MCCKSVAAVILSNADSETQTYVTLDSLRQ